MKNVENLEQTNFIEFKKPEKFKLDLNNVEFVLSGYGDESEEEKVPEHIKNAQAMIDGLYDGITGNEKKETTHIYPKSDDIEQLEIDDDFDLVDDFTLYTGSICSFCGSRRVIPNGTCEACLDCGNTSSCS